MIGPNRKVTRLRRKTPIKKFVIVDVVDELDDLCRQIVLLRDGFCCRMCSKGRNHRAVLQVHHIRSKGAHPELRWELSNLLTLCSGCHKFKAHSPDPVAIAEWYQANLGPAHMDHLSVLISVRKDQKMDRQATKLYLEGIIQQNMTPSAETRTVQIPRQPLRRSARR